jgi:hypothetical protein
MKLSRKKKDSGDEKNFEPPGGCNLSFKKQPFGIFNAFKLYVFIHFLLLFDGSS